MFSATADSAAPGGSPPFVGRSSEIAWLRGLLRRAARGHPVLVLVGGESGVGKSRLVREFLLEAGHQGWQTVWSRCSPGLQVPGSVLTAALVTQAQRAGSPGGRRQPARLDERPRRSGSAELVELATGLAERRPLLLVVDDLHAADAAELEIFGGFAAGIADISQGKRCNLLVIATHQPLASTGRTHLTFQRLLREPVTRVLALDGLDEPEISELLAFGLGWACDPQLIEAVARTTRGNPFFVIQLAGLLGNQGALVERNGRLSLRQPGTELRLPKTAASSVVARFDSLGEETLAVLRTATILGDEFSLEDLAEVCAGIDTAAAADRAVAAGALEERPGGLGFAHQILRTAFESALGPAQRRAIHLRAAQSLHSADAVTRALHLLAAEGGSEPQEALGTLYAQAGDEAMTAYARSTARRLYEASLALPAFVSTLDSASLGWLQCRAARACENDGQGERARELYFEAIQNLRGTPDVRAWGLAIVGWETSFTTAAEPIPSLVHEQEFFAAAGSDAPDVQARLLTQRADALQLARHPEDERVAREAVEMSRRSMSAEAVTAAIATLGLTQMRRLNPEEALESFRAACREAGTIDNPVVRAWGSARVAWPLIVMGRLADASAAAEEALAAARGVHDWAHGALSLSLLHSAALLRGDEESASMHQSDCVRFVDRSGYVQARFILDSAVAWRRLLNAEFDEAMDAVAAWEERAGRLLATPLRLLIQARLGDSSDASRSATAGGWRSPARGEVDFINLGALCVSAELAAACNAPDIAAQVLAALQDVDTGRVVFSMCPPMLVTRARGMCARVLGQHEEAWRDLDIASAQATQAGATIEGALVAVERARLMLAMRTGLDGPVRADLEASLKVFRERRLPGQLLAARQVLIDGTPGPARRPGKQVLDDEFSDIEREVVAEFSKGASPARIADTLLLHERTVEVHLDRVRTRLGIRTPEDAAARLGLQRVSSRRRRPWELTPREIEVLQLIAAGKTNQEIADELVISLHTAIRHVANILEKTGEPNRTSAARLARDYRP